MMKHCYGRFALCLATLIAPLAVRADEPDVQVARVSYTEGDVSYQRGDSDGWNVLGMNTPLVTGDSLYTADDGRAELSLGSGNVLRIDAGTQVDLIPNARDLAQLGLRSGYLSLRARSVPDNATLEIDTPSGAATVLESGIYRVELTDSGARYSAVKGRLSVSLSGQQLDVDAGESLTIEGTDQPTYSFGPVAPQTSFDRWAHDRDVRAERSSSARYVHRDVVGCEDLDDHGYWRNTPEYGRVWTPSGVSSDWAPYRAGRWMWQDPYGWTWVSDESWGWAPYHYGRWLFVGGAWGWVPPPPMGYRGPSVVAEIRPTYAPALVAFVGGKNWSVGVSLGGGPSIGWVPLAPAERYTYPWQPAPQVTNNYTNITVINAVTIVNTTNFASGPVHPIRVPPRQVIHAPIIGSTPTGIVPTHDSLCPSQPRDPHSRSVPHRRDEDDRPLVVRTPPPPKPVPFHEKVVEIQRTGRPFDGHDRGEHNGWNGHGDRDDRIVTVSANSPEGHKELAPRPGTLTKQPRPIDERVETTPHVRAAELPQPRREWQERPAAPPADHPDRDVRNERPHEPQADPRDTKMSQPVQPADRQVRSERPHEPQADPRVAQQAPVPRAIERPVPPSEPERSHGRPAEPTREAHVASPPPAPHAEPAAPAAPVAPVAEESRAKPQHEPPKTEAPKAKDEKAKVEKAKGKDKHAGEGQQQER
jgi:hypothetical protein